jgi:hypothetical protein
MGIRSHMVGLTICRISYRLEERARRFLTMATSHLPRETYHATHSSWFVFGGGCQVGRGSWLVADVSGFFLCMVSTFGKKRHSPSGNLPTPTPIAG